MSKPRTYRFSPEKATAAGVPLVDLPAYAHPVPDVLTYRATSGLPWKSVAAAVGGSLTSADIVHLSYYLEVYHSPDLAIPATPDAAVELRDRGVRWERIAVRAGLPLSSGAVRDLIAEGKGVIPETTKAEKGRRWAEARKGERKPTADAKAYLAGVAVARKSEGVRGDAAQAGRAVEIVAEGRKARRTKKVAE